MEKYRKAIRFFLMWRSRHWKSRRKDSIDLLVVNKGERRIFKDESINGTGEIIALRRYHRYWTSKNRKNRNPLAGDFEKLILDVKERNSRAVRFFAELIDPMLGHGFSICVVPSSDPSVKNNGISYVGRMLAGNGRKDRVGFLIRHSRIQKLSDGGDRSRKTHYDSIRVSGELSVEGEDVLLLDDISTSGNSLLACRDILIANGARSVEMLALGRTYEGGINLLEGSYLSGFGGISERFMIIKESKVQMKI